MQILLGIVLFVATAIAVLFVVGRTSAARRERQIRDAVTRYVEGKGGTIAWDARGGAQIRGPRGEGYEPFHALRMTWKGDDQGWIGFNLRKYMPDEIEEAFTKSARARLAKLRPEIEALPVEAVYEKLRAHVVSTRDDAEGLATCAIALGGRHELRVELAGFDVYGIPSSVRARLPEDDATLRERAIDQTIGASPPDLAAGRFDSADATVLLARAGRLFGDRPFVMAPDADGITWKPVRPRAEAELCALASSAVASKRLKGVLFVWDGKKLVDVGVVTHSIRGPNTPDYTLTMSADTAACLGLTLDNARGVGIRRR